MPIDNNETADNMLNELIEEKNKGENDFFTSNGKCFKRTQNNFVDVPNGNPNV